jgi:hypothetical protein
VVGRSKVLEFLAGAEAWSDDFVMTTTPNTSLFTDEPGEHECVVTRTGTDGVQIRVFWYQDWTPPGRDTGDEVFVCDATVSEFCQTVFACCKRLLDEHGEDGYKGRWIAHEFPIETFERLSRLLYPPRRTVEARVRP